MSDIRLARIYDPPDGGFRVLVDRLWPRGIRKDAAALSLWAKDIAPSNDLRKWFHGGGDFDEFARLYAAELDANVRFDDFAEQVRGHEDAVLLTAAKEPGHSHLSVLREVLLRR